VKRRDVDPGRLTRGRFQADPWRLVELDHRAENLGATETLFTVANGYLGMRGNPEEGRESHAHGTYLNGFHETWQIRHAEAAFGFARTGQTIVNAPDAKVMKLYVDDEPLLLATADLEHYERSLDFRDGILRRSLVWRTPSGKRVRVRTTRMVSMTQRHLAVLTLEVTMLSGEAPIVVSSQLLNRQDGSDEYHVTSAAMGEGLDPRQAPAFDQRVLLPRMSYAEEGRLGLGYRCASSGMTLAVAAEHRIDTGEQQHEVRLSHEDDLAKLALRVEATQGSTVVVEKFVSYHSSRGVPVRELSDRCDRTLDRSRGHGVDHYHDEQRAWYDRYWLRADVQVGADEAIQHAVRFNIFSLAQATARSDQQGIASKGVTGSGYEGHYFWDSEIYVVPFLCYTLPEVARNVIHFRTRMLPAARDRAREMAQSGALYPWRTINGEEASAYYAAGTAQVHIDADIAYALMKYTRASGDEGFLARDGIDLLVETARMWVDLGFWRHNDERTFHIHGVTGPDEYTTVVNNNLFTNVMARANLETAVSTVQHLREHHPMAWRRAVSRLDIDEAEVEEWRACAAGMSIPFDEGLGIHPQDDFFLDREVWDLSRTPSDLFPLLLYYHPLVIYRFQVLKQADVVLAMFLQGDRFTLEQKRANVEYYDPITTGDSSLSAVVQSILAAEVGYHLDALDYFEQALYVDLLDLHGNTVDGLHVASAGGVWQALLHGFAGFRDDGGTMSFDPRLPDGWSTLRFRLAWRGLDIGVCVAPNRLDLAVKALDVTDVTDPLLEGGPGVEHATSVEVVIRGERHVVAAGGSLSLELDCHGPRLPGRLGTRPRTGGVRADGSKISAGVPDPLRHHAASETGELPAVLPGADEPGTG
jgi:alpha,alpha-trehalose phosphorylase